MKKIISLLLAIVCVIGLAACGNADANKEMEHKFTAKILEVNDSSILVEPVKGSNELLSSDKIYVSTKDFSDLSLQVGDYVLVTYDGMIAESYPAQILNVFDIKEAGQSGSDNMSIPNWGLTMEVKDVTNTSLTLVCTQKGGNPTGELMTGSFYVIEQYIDGNWCHIDYFEQEHDIAWTMEAYIIPLNETVDFDIDWSWLYGSFPAGKYRIGKEISDFRGTGDYDAIMYYAEFEIAE
jgi:hypothetical protein